MGGLLEGQHSCQGTFHSIPFHSIPFPCAARFTQPILTHPHVFSPPARQETPGASDLAPSSSYPISTPSGASPGRTSSGADVRSSLAGGLRRLLSPFMAAKCVRRWPAAVFLSCEGGGLGGVPAGWLGNRPLLDVSAALKRVGR